MGRRCLGYVDGTFRSWDYLQFKLSSERFLPITIILTISPEVVIEDLEEREGVPGVGMLEAEDGVHVHSEEWPEELTVLHQQVTEPRKRLGEKTNFSLEDPIPGSFTLALN